MSEDGTPQTAVKWVRKNSKHTGSMKAVLIMLADFIDDGNNCPSQKELAVAAGVSTDTVRRCLGELAKEKMIAIKKAGGKKVKGGQRDCYAINGRAQDDAPETPVADATGSQEPPRTQQHGRPMPTGTQPHGGNREPHVHEDTRDAATRITDLSLEQEKELKEFDATTNSLMLEDTRAQDDAPILAAQTEAQIQQTINTASPQARAAVNRALFEAKNRPATGVTNAPHPVPLDPLPAVVLDAYKARYDEPNYAEHGKLLELLKGRTASEVARLVERCPDKDKYNSPIGNPAGWLLKTTPAPGATNDRRSRNNGYVANSHKQPADARPTYAELVKERGEFLADYTPT